MENTVPIVGRVKVSEPIHNGPDENKEKTLVPRWCPELVTKLDPLEVTTNGELVECRRLTLLAIPFGALVDSTTTNSDPVGTRTLVGSVRVLGLAMLLYAPMVTGTGEVNVKSLACALPGKNNMFDEIDPSTKIPLDMAKRPKNTQTIGEPRSINVPRLERVVERIVAPLLPRPKNRDTTPQEL